MNIPQSVSLGVAMLLATALLRADSPPRPAVQAFEGRVVSIVPIKQGRPGRLVISDKAGKGHRIVGVPASAPVTLNRNSATLSDLDSGDRVAIAADTYGRATEIVALRDRKGTGKRLVALSDDLTVLLRE